MIVVRTIGRLLAGKANYSFVRENATSNKFAEIEKKKAIVLRRLCERLMSTQINNWGIPGAYQPSLSCSPQSFGSQQFT